MKKNLKFISIMLSLVFCFALTAIGQDTTGEIQGTVTDQSGAVVPNVTVTIKGIDVGFNRTVQSDNQGVYRVRQIPPGSYRVTTGAVSGFAEQVKENVQVALGNATTLDFTLSTTVGAVVDVTADAGVLVDPTTTQAQDNLSARDIDALPKGTGFASLLNKTSQVRSDAISGQFTINGSTGPENSFIVDGQEVQNFRTGVLNTANDIPFQSVQELQVRTSGFEAEYGGATGGVVNVVTKSGTNDFRGEFGLQFGTAKLNAGPRNARTTISTSDPSVPSQQFVEYLPQSRDRGTDFFPVASLGGPIIKDKVWFYGIYAPRYFNTTRAVEYYSPVIPSLRVFNGGFDATSKSVQEYALAKIDASPTNNLRFSTSFTWNPYYDEGLLPGRYNLAPFPTPLVVNGQTITGAGLFSRQGGRQNSNNFRAEGVWTPNSKIVTTLRYTRGFLNEKLNSYGIANIPRIRCSFSALPASGNQPALTVAQLQTIAGCNNGFQTTTSNNGIVRDVSIRNTVDADASYLTGGFIGRHEFKGGYQYSKISNDVESGYAQTGIIQLCYGRFSGGSCLGYPTGPLSFNRANAPLGIGQLLRFGAFGAAANTAHTVYLQDKWQPTNRLTFNLGVRMEQEDLPAFNLGTVSTATGLKFNFTDKIAPRLGVAYALTGDGKTKISAFYGKFFDRLKFELPRGSFGGNFFLVDTFIIDPARPLFNQYSIGSITAGIGSRPGGICPVAGPIGTSLCQLDFRTPSNVPGLSSTFGPDVPSDAGTVDPDLKPFNQTEVTVEFQREVMRSSIFSARYLYRNVNDAVEDSGFLTDNFSEFYDIANPCKGMHARHIQELGYKKCVEAKRTYNALQLELDTRFIENFSLNANYTFSRLKGTYSGLANPDEEVGGIGRNSPGVNRYFDQPFVGFNAAGGEDYGLLPLDRTHVFKLSGTYAFDWFGSKTNTTDFTFFTTAQSGTPQTTFVHGFVGIVIPLGERGDLGRTETFTQTDINLTHRYRFGRDDRFTMAFDFNVLNVFNEANVIQLDTNLDGLNWDFEFDSVAPSFIDAVNILTSSGVRNAINSTQGTPQTNPSHFNPGYKGDLRYQGPRSVRFGFRLMF